MTRVNCLVRQTALTFPLGPRTANSVLKVMAAGVMVASDHVEHVYASLK